MKIMIVLNVLLDVFQKREPHYQFSAIVISEALKNNIDAIIPAHSLTTLYYIISKYADKDIADEKIDWMQNFELRNQV